MKRNPNKKKKKNSGRRAKGHSMKMPTIDQWNKYFGGTGALVGLAIGIMSALVSEDRGEEEKEITGIEQTQDVAVEIVSSKIKNNG